MGKIKRKRHSTYSLWLINEVLTRGYIRIQSKGTTRLVPRGIHLTKYVASALCGFIQAILSHWKSKSNFANKLSEVNYKNN